MAERVFIYTWYLILGLVLSLCLYSLQGCQTSPKPRPKNLVCKTGTTVEKNGQKVNWEICWDKK